MLRFGIVGTPLPLTTIAIVIEFWDTLPRCSPPRYTGDTSSPMARIPGSMVASQLRFLRLPGAWLTKVFRYGPCPHDDGINDARVCYCNVAVTVPCCTTCYASTPLQLQQECAMLTCAGHSTTHLL